jgi:ribonucleoside-diphosphate reductase alpha chain
LPADSNECGTLPGLALPQNWGLNSMDFRTGTDSESGDLSGLAEPNSGLTPDLHSGAESAHGGAVDAAVADAAVARSGSDSEKEAGTRPAVTMTEKNDIGTDALVAQIGAEIIANVAAAPQQDDSKSVHPRRFEIVTDHDRDALLTLFGKDTLDDRYLLPGEKYQDLFARVADAYADDQDHAQRLYDYISKLWFMPATPVLSNGGTGRGLPISCYLNSVSDSLEGIVGTWNENVLSLIHI